MIVSFDGRGGAFICDPPLYSVYMAVFPFNVGLVATRFTRENLHRDYPPSDYI